MLHAQPRGTRCSAFWERVKISKPGPIEIEIVFTLGATGGGQLGCLDCSNCQVASLLGANPFDSRTLHALPNKPALPNENQISVVCSCLVMWLAVFLLVVFGKVQRVPNSFLDHKLHRKSTEVGTSTFA